MKHLLPSCPCCACPMAKFQTPDRSIDIMPPATCWYDFCLAFLYSLSRVFYILITIHVSGVALVRQLLQVFPFGRKESTSYYFPATVLEEVEHIQSFSANPRKGAFYNVSGSGVGFWGESLHLTYLTALWFILQGCLRACNLASFGGK